MAAVAADLPAWLVCHGGDCHACGHDTSDPGQLPHRTGEQWVSGVAHANLGKVRLSSAELVCV